MNNEIKNDLPANWPVWTRKIVNDLQAAEDMAGKWFLDKAPDWAERIWSELIKLIFATVNVADYQESGARFAGAVLGLSLIHISEPTRLGMISYAVFCL